MDMLIYMHMIRRTLSSPLARKKKGHASRLVSSRDTRDATPPPPTHLMYMISYIPCTYVQTYLLIQYFLSTPCRGHGASDPRGLEDRGRVRPAALGLPPLPGGQGVPRVRAPARDRGVPHGADAGLAFRGVQAGLSQVTRWRDSTSVCLSGVVENRF